MRFFTITAAAMSVALLTAGAGALAQEAEDFGDDWVLSVPFAQQDAFTAGVEVWTPHVARAGYWESARLGAGFGLRAYDEADADGELQHVGSWDASAGFAMDSRRRDFLRVRSVFLAGYASVDRHALATLHPDGRDPTSYGYFDTRHGFGLVPPTHEAKAPAAAGEPATPSLLELGVGFRWNFIGRRRLQAGDDRVRELTVYPYLAANMFL